MLIGLKRLVVESGPPVVLADLTGGLLLVVQVHESILHQSLALSQASDVESDYLGKDTANEICGQTKEGS